MPPPRKKRPHNHTGSVEDLAAALAIQGFGNDMLQHFDDAVTLGEFCRTVAATILQVDIGPPEPGE